eukprot:2073659-Amphidinium_carterae.1
MAAMFASSTSPASGSSGYVLGLEQQISSMETTPPRRPFMDSGAAAHLCCPQYAEQFGAEYTVDNDEVAYKKNASGGTVLRSGACQVSQKVQRSDGSDGTVTITYEALDVARPIWSVGKWAVGCVRHLCSNTRPMGRTYR